MKPPLSAEELEKLGLGSVTFGKAEFIPFPTGDVGEGSGPLRQVLPLAALAAAGFADVAFRAVRSAAAEEVGVSVQRLVENRHIVGLSAGESATPVLRTAHDDPQGVAADPDSPATRYVDLTRCGAACFAREDGTGIVLIPAENGHEIIPFLTDPLRVEPLAELSSDLPRWCSEMQDAWLRDLLRRLLDAGGSWHQVVAVGICARLQLPPEPEGAGGRVERLLAGEIDEELARPRRWASALSTAEVRTVEDLALAEIDRLHSLIEELGAAEELDASWKPSVLLLLHARDDLEGVRVLLAEADLAAGGSRPKVEASRRVDSALEDLDREGALLADDLDGLFHFDDERLRRAAELDRATWWVRLAS